VTGDPVAAQGGSSREPNVGGSAAAPFDDLALALADVKRAFVSAFASLLLPVVRVLDDAGRRLPSWVTGGDGR
jgi:hypothetical protein